MAEPRPRTHLKIDPELCGTPTLLAEGEATVEMVATPAMAADEEGLVHGGFVFGQADYAAMLAVDDPRVVLAAAEVRFVAPARVGETLVAHARVESVEGRKHFVEATVRRGEADLMRGRFTAFIPDRHVLSREVAS